MFGKVHLSAGATSAFRDGLVRILDRATLLCALGVSLASVAACAQVLGVPDAPTLFASPDAAPPFESSPTLDLPLAGADGGADPGLALTVPPIESSPTTALPLVRGGSGVDPGLGVPAASEPNDAGEAAPGCASAESVGPDGNCYAVVQTPLPWLLARIVCRARGSGWDLVAIEDAASNEFVAALLTEDAWMGASDAAEEGSWRWVRDGTSFWIGNDTGGPVNGSFNDWSADEPNDRGGSDCARIVAGTAQWADLDCGESRRAVCEGPPS